MHNYSHFSPFRFLEYKSYPKSSLFVQEFFSSSLKTIMSCCLDELHFKKSFQEQYFSLIFSFVQNPAVDLDEHGKE